MIPYGHQDLNQADIEAVIEVLQSDFLNQGPTVSLFENTVSDYYGFRIEAGDSCRLAYAHCLQNDWQDIILCGVSDLAEIAILRAYEAEINIAGIYDPHTEHDRFINNDIYHDLADLPAHDGYLITDLNAPKVSYEYLASKVGAEKIIVPGVLRLDIQEI